MTHQPGFEDGEFLSMEYRRRNERHWQYECCVCGLRHKDQSGASLCCLPAITGEVEQEDWSADSQHLDSFECALGCHVGGEHGA